MSRKSAMDAVFAARPAAAVPAVARATPQDALEASNERTSEKGSTHPLEASNPPSPSRIRSGAIAAMGASLEQLASRAQAAESIESGSAIVELEPNLIDGSFVADRVSDATDPTFEALIESIRESGQHVPILVRPHPKASDRFQIAYGHRRARAAEKLGIRVRAVVRALTDAELVVAQGKENLDRRDLSYIERAFFALRLEALSFPRDVICSAMGVHKPDLSNFITVARMLPEDIVSAIGPAPKAGGPRWRLLADRMKEGGRKRLDVILRDPEFQTKSTDERFLAVFGVLAPKAMPGRAMQPWTDEQGRELARVSRSGRRFTLSIDEKMQPEFGEYLLGRLPEILAAHRAKKD